MYCMIMSIKHCKPYTYGLHGAATQSGYFEVNPASSPWIKLAAGYVSQIPIFSVQGLENLCKIKIFMQTGNKINNVYPVFFFFFFF